MASLLNTRTRLPIASSLIVLSMFPGCASTRSRPSVDASGSTTAFPNNEAPPAFDDAIRVKLPDSWVQEVRPVAELSGVRRGIRLGVLLRNGAKLTGVSMGSDLATPSVMRQTCADAAARGYLGPVLNDSMVVETTLGEEMRGRCAGLIPGAVLMQTSIGMHTHLVEQINRVWFRQQWHEAQDLARMMDAYPEVDARVLLLGTDQPTAARPAPVPIPVGLIRGFRELSFEWQFTE